MPHFDIIKKVAPKKSFRVASVMGSYDLQSEKIEEHFVGDLNLPKDWQIGLIVGNSGTGKTTIAKELFPDAYITKFEYTHESILDDMPKSKSTEEITRALNSVGFSSPPSWLKPYSVLSGGEKMRCDLARAILQDDEMFVFDEFTSVVDRNVAKVGSYAMQKAIRRTNKKFIAVGCHFDVEDWLLPDWVFDTNNMTFRLCEGQKKNRPELRWQIYEVSEKSYYWQMFRRYHYLSHTHNNAAHVFVATLDGQLCGFCSMIFFPHPVTKNMWRVHRIVILPDYQGIGLGMRLINDIARIFTENHKVVTITTSNASFVKAMAKSPRWAATGLGRKCAVGKTSFFKKDCTSRARITASFRYKAK